MGLRAAAGAALLSAASCGGDPSAPAGPSTSAGDATRGRGPASDDSGASGDADQPSAGVNDGVREGSPDVVGRDDGASPGDDSGASGGSPECDPTQLPPAGELIGWASVGPGTTGGGDAEPQLITGGQQFSLALEGDEPAVLVVNGSLQGRFLVGSNKTIVGVCGARLSGHVRFSGSENVIFQNLAVVGSDCAESPDDCSAGDDAISVLNDAHHIWFDHLDVSDGSDGNLDITQGSDFITVSWSKFHYSSARTDAAAGESGHRFSNLIGASDNNVARSGGKLNVTFHHNWWADNVDQRMPRSRYGEIHVLNNLYTSAGNSYCTNAGFMATLLVENNLYRGVNRPLAPAAGGNMLAVGNSFRGTEGNTEDTGVGFTPPYEYSAEPADSLEQTITLGVGPR